MSLREEAGITLRMVWYSALGVAFAVAVVLIGWKMLPMQMAVERDAMQNSHQYTDAKRGMLIKMADEYESGETDIARYRASDAVKFKDVIQGLETQQESLLARIRHEARMIPSSQVPDSVRKYMQ